MPIVDTIYRDFSKENVDKSPDQPGVYALFIAQQGGYGLIYYGRAKVSIRQRLQRHFNGDEGPCTQSATHYMREPNSSPVSREKELLQEWFDKYGDLPDCNEQMP
jgi:excinuclease UvrABC nuclease subunit